MLTPSVVTLGKSRKNLTNYTNDTSVHWEVRIFLGIQFRDFI